MHLSEKQYENNGGDSRQVFHVGISKCRDNSADQVKTNLPMS
jgi:hypothetical protein